MTNTPIDWTDVEAAAKEAAGSWTEIHSSVWHRACRLSEPDAWMLYYTSNRDSKDKAKATEEIINMLLRPFSKGADPDVVFERHYHWAVAYLDGFSLRVVKPDGTVTEAFKEFCRIMEDLEASRTGRVP
jgi:hypothetical protein